MKNSKLFIPLFVTIFFSYVTVSAQIALDHVYTGPLPVNRYTTGPVIPFSSNGKKIAFQDSNQIKLYNLDHTLWKTITPPVPSGYELSDIFFISDNLFNNDNLVELIVSYFRPPSQPPYRISQIINENGSVIQDLDSASVCTLHRFKEDQYKLITMSSDLSGAITKVYSLPGTMPCESCNGALGVVNPGIRNTGFISEPVPNPSNNSTTIEYKLPQGVYEGQLNIYSSSGTKVNSFRVTNTAGSIVFNNSELISGSYYYNLSANGNTSETKKMIVIK